ncbi:MAG: PEGA domain-containing protein [Opitutaceae bacterium]
MSTTICLIEETDFSLLVARATAGAQSLRIDAVQEIPAGDADTPQAALRKVIPENPATVVCAFRPKNRSLHLANADQAKRHSGLAGAQQFAAANPAFAGLPPSWFAAMQARDGAFPNGSPWLLQVANAANRPPTNTALGALHLSPNRRVSATFNAVGAFVSAASAPLWLLEIGELSTEALLINRDGVVAAGPLSLNLDRIAEVVQAELGLKFRGSAVRLFFNPDYDFTEVGPKIVARLAPALKAELTALRAAHAAPSVLACVGLPAGQHWFVAQLAAALGLNVFAPASKVAGLTFASPELEAAISPAWLGLLSLAAGTRTAAPSPWQAEWLKLGDALPVNPTPATPASAIKTPSPSAAAPAAKIPAPPVDTSKAAPTPPPKAVIPAMPIVTESAVSYPPKPAKQPQLEKKPNGASAPKPAPTPVAAAPGNRDRVSAKETATTPFYKKPLALAAAGLAVLIAGGAFFYIHTQKQEALRLADEMARTELRLKAEAEKARLAQQQAETEAAARKTLETESARKLAEAEAGLKRAESETRAIRLANARGILVVSTQPAGATITVPGLPPRLSPATFSDLKIGRYAVTVALPNYEEATLNLEVRENATTESEPIQLVKLVGALSIASDPPGTGFDLVPANVILVAPDAHRTGRTPATVENLTPGEYKVTFTRAGWKPHTETVSVARDATATLAWKFSDGLVKISTSPEGVAVIRNGANLGVTPLTLQETPGAVRYELALDGYDPVTVSGSVEGGSTLDLTAKFAAADRIFTAAELDQAPEPIGAKQPEFPYYLTVEKGRVEIQVTLNRDASIRDLKLLSTTNRDLVKFCLAAVEKWKFKPGLKGGKPVISRVIVPITVTPPKS